MILDRDILRARFAERLSSMYRAEVPQYAALLALVARVNREAGMEASREAGRVAVERHGAIRVGRADEFCHLARLFGVFGMEPVGYYDLAPSGIPVHSTAFRPITEASLARNPFRVFTSLLRLDLVADRTLRAEADAILARRVLFGPAFLLAIERAEGEGGVDAADADVFLAHALDLFRWHQDAVVDAATYARLLKAHPLIADVVAFRGPHLNHLTPRTFDIDTVHRDMPASGMEPKATIEGPPRRRVPVLLRQTSCKALQEQILFPGRDGGAPSAGAHTARFGEVESRGAALTRRGRALYDGLLASGTLDRFPDDWSVLRREGLVFARRTADANGVVETPITYEDFLPVSAAGIFRSNLGAAAPDMADTEPTARRGMLEDAAGKQLLDEFLLYETLERGDEIVDAAGHGERATSPSVGIGTPAGRA